MRNYIEYDAVWGRICEFHNGCIVDRFQIPEVDYFDQLIRHDPYYTLQIGHFVKTALAQSYPFDESMNCGEDWKYFLDVWRNHRCIKQRAPLMVNRRGMHSTGPKSATGRDWSETVGKLIQDERTKLRA